MEKQEIPPSAEVGAIRQAILATADAVLFSLLPDGRLAVLLPRRTIAPFRDARGLPGVLLDPDRDDDAEAGARRALASKVDVRPAYLEQLHTFSGRHRDPRGWSVSIAYYALLPWRDLAPAAADMIPLDELPSLAFDHDDIVATALARLRGKASYSTLPLHLMAAEFTLAELQTVYEAVMGEALSTTTFRRWTDEMLEAGMIAETGRTKPTGRRPAKLYRHSPGHAGDTLAFLPSIAERRR